MRTELDHICGPYPESSSERVMMYTQRGTGSFTPKRALSNVANFA